MKDKGLWNEEWDKKRIVSTSFKLLRDLRQFQDDGSSGFGGNRASEPTMNKIKETVWGPKQETIEEVLSKKLKQLTSIPEEERSVPSSQFLECMAYLLRKESSFPREIFQEISLAMNDRLSLLLQDMQQ